MPEKVIVVTGTRYKVTYDGTGSGFLGYLEQGYDGEPNPTLSPETGGGSSVEEIEVPGPLDTPCVTAPPDGKDLQAINTAALVAALQISALADHRIEYGIIIYEFEGQIRWTPPFTQKRTDRIGYDFSNVPDGAHVLAVIHNHPDLAGVDDSYPSIEGLPNDWDAYDDLRGKTLARGITVNPKLLMYIFTNQNRDLWVYDRNKKGTTEPSCKVNPKPIR